MAASVPLERVPPTTASYVIASAILAGVLGFFIGQGASLGLFSSATAKSSSERRKASSEGDKAQGKEDSSSEEDWENESDEEDGGELATFAGNNDEVKLVLVVRTDLGMGKGSP
jgi:hypothetical protein